MFGKLISALGVAAIRGEVTAATRRLRLRAILAAVAVVLWILVFAFALAALAVWLASLVGPLWACAILAGFFALVAIGVQVWLHLVKSRGSSFAANLSRALAPIREAAEADRRQQHAAAPGSHAAAPGTDGHAEGGSHHMAEATSVGAMMVLAVVGYVMGRHFWHGDQPPPPGSDR
jgi:hypothetical protein